MNLDLVDLFHNPEDSRKFMQEIAELDVMKNKDFTLKKKNKKKFWASITSTAVRNKSCEILYYDTVVEDISERKKLQEEVKRLSITDELTGLYNRRYFNKKLHEEIKTGEKWNSSLSLIMIDIDDFKPYNDTYHHLQGDEVIKEAAHVISQNIRKDKDWATRFGGDEFVIVLPGINAKNGIRIAERIGKTFRESKFRPKGEIVTKTISIGIADCFHREKKSSNGKKREFSTFNYEKIATQLISLADEALYKAKKTGKNQMVISEKSIELSRNTK